MKLQFFKFQRCATASGKFTRLFLNSLLGAVEYDQLSSQQHFITSCIYL